MPILKAPGLWKISGDLSLPQIPDLLEVAGDFADIGQDVVLDLSGVQVVDTATISLLLELRRRAAQHNKTLSYANLPENLQGLARLYGMESLLSA